MNARKLARRALPVIVVVPLVLFAVAAGWYYARFYAAHRADHTIVSAGHRREYLLHVPRDYDRAHRVPLVIGLHGAMMWPAAQMHTSQWNRVADAHGFLVVYPSGTTLSGKGTGVLPKVWRLGPEAALSADVGFIADLIDTLEATYHVDPARIYVAGRRADAGVAAWANDARDRRVDADVGVLRGPSARGRALTRRPGGEPMAKGYWITIYRSVSDPARLAEYAAVATPVLEAGGGRVIARGVAARTFEGGADQRTVIVEFETVEQAIAAYESPRYQAARAKLAGAVDREVRIVSGV